VLVLAGLALAGYLFRGSIELRLGGEPQPPNGIADRRELPGRGAGKTPQVGEGLEAAEAERPLAKKVKAAPAKALSGAEIQQTVQRSSAAIGRCIDNLAGVQNAPSQVNATITIGTHGKVTNVGLQPALPQAAADQCLRGALKSLKFRTQPVEGFQVTIPLKIQVL
ncbi:MAG: hypothetical protein HYZ27_06985, partial [Deltaproteobacteria bacterium]|nr:hypothetical protein [Deltaproteobacteria bacterium]